MLLNLKKNTPMAIRRTNEKKFKWQIHLILGKKIQEYLAVK
jgi:hypothetical protein